MHGNMPLAMTGQEAVWQNTLKKYGMNDDEIQSFLTGPAYGTWQWLSNIEGDYYLRNIQTPTISVELVLKRLI